MWITVTFNIKARATEKGNSVFTADRDCVWKWFFTHLLPPQMKDCRMWCESMYEVSQKCKNIRLSDERNFCQSALYLNICLTSIMLENDKPYPWAIFSSPFCPILWIHSQWLLLWLWSHLPTELILSSVSCSVLLLSHCWESQTDNYQSQTFWMKCRGSQPYPDIQHQHSWEW